MLDTSRPNDEHSKFVTGRRLVRSTIINTVNVASYYPKVSVNRQEEEYESVCDRAVAVAVAVCCAWVLIDVAAVAPWREATVPG